MANWKKLLVGEWNWLRPVKSTAFIYLALLVIALGFADRFIYQPPAAGYSRGSLPVCLLETQGGTQIATIHLPAKPGMPTLLWSHGNAEDIGYLEPRFQDFNTRGYGILAYDYPGYGMSGGKPDERGCYDACLAAWNHLTGPLGVAPEDVIIYGQSVGSGSAVWLASDKPSGGLMLVSPFVSAFRAVTKYPLFPGDRFNNLSRIGTIRTPLLVVHGDKDQVISQWHGKKLHARHPGPKTFLNVPGAGHNDLYQLATNDILDALDTFRRENKIAQRHTKPNPRIRNCGF